MEKEGKEESIIMAALSSLSSSQLLRLSHSLSSDLRRRHGRLSSILSSPFLFSLTLRRLRSLPLPSKSILLGRHLLSCLRLLLLLPPRSAASATLRLHDYDAVLLLLLLCDLRRLHPDALDAAPPSEWRVILRRHFSAALLSTSGLGAPPLAPFVEEAAHCRRILSAMDGDGSGKVEREVAASPAAVVALPSVEVAVGGRGGGACAVCKEEMEGGRDLCELPCQHRFHWICILPWVRQRNTCPCCRHRLPTDDVFGEIQRLWEVLVKIGGAQDPSKLWAGI